MTDAALTTCDARGLAVSVAACARSEHAVSSIALASTLQERRDLGAEVGSMASSFFGEDAKEQVAA
jgi:hypothetical protein